MVTDPHAAVCGRPASCKCTIAQSHVGRAQTHVIPFMEASSLGRSADAGANRVLVPWVGLVWVCFANTGLFWKQRRWLQRGSSCVSFANTGTFWKQVNVILIWPMPSMTPSPPRSQAQISTPDRSPHITHSQACPTTVEVSTPDRSPRITHSQACPTTVEASTPGRGHPRAPSPEVPTAVEVTLGTGTRMTAATRPGPGRPQLAVVATIPTMTATETPMEEGVLDPTLTEIIMAETDTPHMATSKVTR
ncbi:glycoprotein Xg isoform X8 [Leopardus geoffroyi]|uniref:glycoprotein Xg isoform X8 n=1 Tax=Leopardus geoffroyi TaxID=46844 RepID=UPI001E260F3C|nr:glycoprotein Xg isoform X8 [Leopardus geoffroyi]